MKIPIVIAIIFVLGFSMPFGVLSQVESQVASPRQQMESGISPADVVCKGGFVLMLRALTGDAACVSPLTGSALESRGWGTVESEPFAQTETQERVSIEIDEKIGISSEPEN